MKKPNINLWLGKTHMDTFFESSTLVVDLSNRVKRNKWLFKDKYQTISEYFKKSDISNWWNPEEGKGDVGQGLFANIQKEKRKMIQNWMKDKKFKKILEVGPGTGRFTDFLSVNFKDITCVEINDKFYKKLKQKNYSNVLLVHDDITQIQFKKDMFDCVILVDVIMHISNIPELFKNIKCWLKENGFLIVDFTPLKWYEYYNKIGTVHRGIDKKEFEVMLKHYQFEITQMFEQKNKDNIVQYLIYMLNNKLD